MARLKNRIIARLLTRFPRLFDRSVEKAAAPVEVTGTPWAPFKKPLRECGVVLVTTAGVHLRGQKPFDMDDPQGDPSYRALPSDTPLSGYTITHDYYDHRDADRDLNIVFPIERLGEMVREGELGSIAPVNYGFMGHIDGPHVETLINKTAPEVAEKIRSEGADFALLTPG